MLALARSAGSPNYFGFSISDFGVHLIIGDTLQDPGVVALIGQRSYALLPQFDPAGINLRSEASIIFRLGDREREFFGGVAILSTIS